MNLGGWGDDDILTWSPVCRSSNMILVSLLQGHHHTLDLIKITASGGRIVHDGPHHTFTIDDEYSTNCWVEDCD